MSIRVVSRWSALTLAALLAASSAAAQPGGGRGAVVTGQVVDSASGTPLPNAEVFVPAADPTQSRGTRTTLNGRYTINGVPAGAQTVRVRLLGYAASERAVTLRDGETATVNFALAQRSAVLDQIVVTGTGGATQKRAVGNVIETIDADQVRAVAPTRNVEQLVGQRTPGVIILPGTGQVGTGAQIRIRAATSLSLSNDPIIYIDGVRMDASAARGFAQRGGAGASRLNDVNPEDIESIEILKGPAASTLYGTEASNGVIQIITKRGKSGKATWNFATRQGTNWLMNPEGRAGMLYGRNTTTGNIDSVNLYAHEAALNGPIFHNGPMQGYNLDVSGGTDASRYFVAGSYDNDVGVVSWNWDHKFTGRANLDALVGKKLQFQGNVAYINDRIRLAQVGGIDADPFSQLVWGTPLTLGKIQRGFNQTPPEEWSTVQSHADEDRTTLGLTATHNPWSWLTQRLVAGLDVGSENNWLLYPRQPLGSADPLGSAGLGNKNVQRAYRNILTLDYSANAKYDWRGTFDFTSTVGLQHYRNTLSTINATASTFSATPLTTISSGATTSSGETYVANATVGVFGQEAIGWLNRRFLVVALRGDDNSAFGQSFKAAYYPKVSGSWVLSEEPFFKVPGIDNLRLRFAYGAAGRQPGTFDASRLYDPIPGYQNAPGLIPGSYGNPQLKPERSAELETGFETTLFGSRVDLSYTHYSRDVRDEIVNAPIAPSLGFPGSQVLNLGRVKAWGDELGANVKVFQGRRVSWELGSQLATNGNRIIDLGDGRTSLTVGGGSQAQNRVGFSVADMFLYKVRSAQIDATGKVLSAVCDGGTGKQGLEMGGPDVSCAQAPRVLWGHTQPTWQLGFNSTLTLWRNFRFYARVDGNGGNWQSDTEIRALHNQGSTLAVIQRNDPLLQEYRSIENDAVGMYEAGFMRLRELSASYTLPNTFARRLGASNASVSLAGRNLMMLWTAQDGWSTSRDGEITVPLANQHVWDPEIRAVGDLSNGFQTIMPPTASLTATVRLSF